MNCSTFRENHGPFLDDMLDEADVVSMQCHLAECAECGALDTRIRRAQLLFRNVPRITPSAGFAERLNERLFQEQRATVRALMTPPKVATRGPGLGVFAAAAASVATVGYLAAATFAHHQDARALALPPVVATRVADAALVAEASQSPVSSPAIMASVSAGMPIWPTALLVDQAPLHFATSEFQLTSYGR
jgi:hypothetical protein